MKSFTEKVREHRGQLGLGQQELADKAGIGVRTLTYYECGKRFPQAAQLYKLAKALGVSTEYLKNDEIEDPGYGMDRMDYVEEMRQKGGRRESLDLEEMLRENQALFAGGTISEEAKDAYFQAVMKAYLECKEAAQGNLWTKEKDCSRQAVNPVTGTVYRESCFDMPVTRHLYMGRM